MSADKTGGSAFPKQPIWRTPDGMEITMDQGGMTLRDYFIAHAPAEPQPWFAPVMPPKPVDAWEIG
jgi:hypothetical protein